MGGEGPAASRLAPRAPIRAPRSRPGLSPGLPSRSPAPCPARTSSRRPAPSTFLPHRAFPAPGLRRNPAGRRSAPGRSAGPAMKASQAADEEAPLGARSVKVVLVGDGGCGKTSLLMVFAEGAFPEVSAGALRARRPRLCAHPRLATDTHGLLVCPVCAGAVGAHGCARTPARPRSCRGSYCAPSGRELPRRCAPAGPRGVPQQSVPGSKAVLI